MTDAWHATVLTIFPEMFPGPLGQSLAGRALEKGTWRLDAVNIRDFATDKHRSVDDTPFGGGAGMVMRPDILDAAIKGAGGSGPLIYMTPRGRLMDQPLVRRRAILPHELAREGPRRHRCPPRQLVPPRRSRQVRLRPRQHRRQSLLAPVPQRLDHELSLPAIPVRRHHQAPRH